MLYYHYCNFDKFKSIIKSKTLWLTQIVKSNDTEEISRTFKIIWKTIKPDIEKELSSIQHSSKIIQILDNQMHLELQCDTPYGLCLTKNRDLAQNWNEYGDSSRGIALGFSSDLFVEIPYEMPHPSSCLLNSIGWHEVYYDRENLSKKFIPIFVYMLKNDQSVIGWLNVRTTLKHYSAFIKNPTFQDEREIRIIYYPQKNHPKSFVSEVKGSIDGEIAHCTLPWVKNNGICSLKEIIIGTNCPITKDEIKNILYENGVTSEVTISISEYPYRISQNR